MKIILCEDQPKLGIAGDIKEVSEGYARNYLLPKRLALAATPPNIKKWESEEKNRQVRSAHDLETAKSLAAQVENLNLEIEAKAGKEKHLFGSITSAIISESLLKKGISVDRKHIILDAPIKTLGEFQVQIRLHTQVNATLKVRVAASQESEPQSVS